MTKTLFVPDHVAAARKNAVGADIYVNKEERVLDPTLLDKKLSERLPQPTGWRIIVMPYMGKAVTNGGVHLPDATVEREALATVVAYVLKVGPLAYQDSVKFGSEGASWCQEGDWVMIGRYAGCRFKINGGQESDWPARIINDDEVIATILEPDDIKHV